MENEANLSVIGEHTFYYHTPNLIGISIHTGIGVGILINNQLYTGLGDRLVWQAVSICVFSLLSLLVLRKPIKSWFNRSQVYEDTLCEGGEGEIREGMVYFKGTLWAYENSQRVFKEGDKVKVIKIHNNKAIIENL